MESVECAPGVLSLSLSVLPPHIISFTFLLHVHLLDLLAVQDLDGDLVAGQDVLRDLDLEREMERGCGGGVRLGRRATGPLG